MKLFVLCKDNLLRMETDWVYSFYPETYYYYGQYLKPEMYKLISFNPRFAIYEFVETKYTYLSKDDLGL